MTEILGSRRGAAPSLHHVAIGTGDVLGLSRFYCELFGVSELERHHHHDGSLRSVWLDLSGVLLMIEHSREDARRYSGVGSGPFLLAFRASAEEREELEKRAVALGQTIESRSAFTSYTRDSDGNRIAFSQYEPAR